MLWLCDRDWDSMHVGLPETVSVRGLTSLAVSAGCCWSADSSCRAAAGLVEDWRLLFDRDSSAGACSSASSLTDCSVWISSCGRSSSRRCSEFSSGAARDSSSPAWKRFFFSFADCSVRIIQYTQCVSNVTALFLFRLRGEWTYYPLFTLPYIVGDIKF